MTAPWSRRQVLQGLVQDGHTAISADGGLSWSRPRRIPLSALGVA